MERSAARGMLSCRPAHATRRRERDPGGSRWSSAPTCRRNARICDLVRSSRALVSSDLCGELRSRSTSMPPTGVRGRPHRAAKDPALSHDDAAATDEDTPVDIDNVKGGSAELLAGGRKVRFTPAANANDGNTAEFSFTYK